MRGHFYTVSVMIMILFRTEQVHSRGDTPNILGKCPIRILAEVATNLAEFYAVLVSKFKNITLK
jgi:hypothetical protein